MTAPGTGLERYHAAERMLAEISTMKDADDVMRLAEAARVFAERERLGTEMINHATAIKLKAGNRLIELYEVQKRPRGNPHGKSGGSPDLLPLRKATDLRRVAKVLPSDEAVDSHVAKVTAEGGRVSIDRLLRQAKEVEREAKRDENRRLVADAPAITDAFTEGSRFSTIVIDPPWDWNDEGDIDQFGRATPTYSTMPLADVAALPVGELAEKNAHLYLWITNRSLPKGFALLETWGFRYVTCLTWCKPSIGMGNYYRGSTEQVLFGVRGSLSLLRSDLGTWFPATRGGRHSSKPEAFYAMVESASPGPWVDMFGRKRRAGWSIWGAESAA